MYGNRAQHGRIVPTAAHSHQGCGDKAGCLDKQRHRFIDSCMRDPQSPETSGPPRALPYSITSELGSILEQAAAGGPIRGKLIDRLAKKHGVPASHLYVAAATRPELQFARDHKVAFVVCGGGCQEKGALDCLDHLVELRRPLLKKWFKKAFDIETRGCLNRCDHGPAIRIDSRHGAAHVDRATRDALSEAVETLCG